MSRLRILIVEDHKPVARLMAGVLKAKGYEIEIVHSGEAALDVLSEVHPDLVLLDVNLRDIQGVDILRSIQGDDSLGGVPVVLVSDVGRLRPLAILNGAAGYLPKPFNLEELIGVVEASIIRSERIAS